MALNKLQHALSAAALVLIAGPALASAFEAVNAQASPVQGLQGAAVVEQR